KEESDDDEDYVDSKVKRTGSSTPKRKANGIARPKKVSQKRSEQKKMKLSRIPPSWTLPYLKMRNPKHQRMKADKRDLDQDLERGQSLCLCIHALQITKEQSQFWKKI